MQQARQDQTAIKSPQRTASIRASSMPRLAVEPQVITIKYLYSTLYVILNNSCIRKCFKSQEIIKMYIFYLSTQSSQSSCATEKECLLMRCHSWLLTVSVSLSVCWMCVQPGLSADSKLMKRSFSTIGDQCVNGLWQEQHSLERVSPDDTYRPRQRSYRGHIVLLKHLLMHILCCLV